MKKKSKNDSFFSSLKPLEVMRVCLNDIEKEIGVNNPLDYFQLDSTSSLKYSLKYNQFYSSHIDALVRYDILFILRTSLVKSLE